MKISWSSDHTLRIALGDSSPLRAAYQALRSAALPGVRDITPASTTIQLTFDPLTLDPPTAERSVREALAAPSAISFAAQRTITIPVCYDSDFAPDLAFVAAAHSLGPAEVVALHTAATYTVQFLGFSPGFAYLSGLSSMLATPRLDRPRLSVPPGSVGIGGDQTGVYPHATPGGWRLIGRTPLIMFNVTSPEPARLAIGDAVRFTSISRQEFDELARREAHP